MKRNVATLIIGACLLAGTSCETKPTEAPPEPAPAKGPATEPAPPPDAAAPASDVTAHKASPQGHKKPFSPWIADGKPGVFSPSEDFAAGNVYGVVHGVSILSEDGTHGYVIEQWFAAKADKTISAGLALKEFPNFLPLATAASASTKELFWGYGRLTDGMPSDVVTPVQFYDSIAGSLLKDHTGRLRYGFGLALQGEGTPPTMANGGLPDSTPGISETITVKDLSGCHWSVFALEPRNLDKDLLEQNKQRTFERSRRILQAWTKDCGMIDTSDPKRSIARASTVESTTYDRWLNMVSTWSDVSRADGIVLIDDEFVPMDQPLRNAESLARTLLSR